MMRYDARIAVEAALQEKVSHPPRSLLLS
jgi:hypothetical protein